MSLLLLIFWCAVGAVCLTVALTIFVRFSTAIRRLRLARYQRVVRNHLTAYVVGARDDPPARPRRFGAERQGGGGGARDQGLRRLGASRRGAARPRRTRLADADPCGGRVGRPTGGR